MRLNISRHVALVGVRAPYCFAHNTPNTDALNAAIGSSDTPGRNRVYIAMQGEMSATIMRHPVEYITAYGQLRSRLARPRNSGGDSALPTAHAWIDGARVRLAPVDGDTLGRGGLDSSLHKIGISFNFNKLETANTGLPDRWRVISFAFGGGRSAPGKPGIDVSGVERLFNTVDFVG